jgi:hypothetical protein
MINARSLQRLEFVSHGNMVPPRKGVTWMVSQLSQVAFYFALAFLLYFLSANTDGNTYDALIYNTGNAEAR